MCEGTHLLLNRIKIIPSTRHRRGFLFIAHLQITTIPATFRSSFHSPVVIFKALTPLLRIIFGVRYGLRLSNAIQIHTHPHLFAVKPCAPTYSY